MENHESTLRAINVINRAFFISFPEGTIEDYFTFVDSVRRSETMLSEMSAPAGPKITMMDGEIDK